MAVGEGHIPLTTGVAQPAIGGSVVSAEGKSDSERLAGGIIGIAKGEGLSRELDRGQGHAGNVVTAVSSVTLLLSEQAATAPTDGTPVVAVPTRDEIDTNVKEQLIIEFYSR